MMRRGGLAQLLGDYRNWGLAQLLGDHARLGTSTTTWGLPQLGQLTRGRLQLQNWGLSQLEFEKSPKLSFRVWQLRN